MPSILDDLNFLLTNKRDYIEEWFTKQFGRTQPFVYNSIDIRNAGFKLAPVDTNIFPAGFNNLNAPEKNRAEQTLSTYLKRYYPEIKKILLLIEDHTRNKLYLENARTLESIITHAGYEVRVASMLASEQNETLSLTTASDASLTVYPLHRKENKIETSEGFSPDLVIINNDLTTGIPALLEHIAQPIIPPIELGWFRRRKTAHFETYNTLATQLCQNIELDPWRISTFFHRCGMMNFKERTGVEYLAESVETVLAHIRRKYREYGIDEEPYVFIKSDMGTYGMGIMTARSGKDILAMNKDSRTKMNVIKGGAKNTEVIIQEGVPTIDQVEGNTAEPMMYLIGGEPVGCLYRINSERSAYENLNSAGMLFESIEHHANKTALCPALSLIAKLASFAAAWECYEVSYSI